VSNGYLIGHIVSDVNELNWPGPYSKEQNTNAAADKALYVKIADVTKSAPNTAKRITEDIDKKMGEWKEKNQKQRDAVVAAAVENSNATRLPAKFMSPENNSIVRSFESTIGRGLAGFIESMSFDWYDRTVWNLDKNQKAPMMCKVNVSFSPVHDISPGLDSFGHNRAAIYPIGNYFTPADRVRTPPGQPAKTNSK
jgi:hypothetical protein